MPSDIILAVDDEKHILALYRRIFMPPERGKFDVLGTKSERVSLPPLDCRTYENPLEAVAEYRCQFAAGVRASVCILDILMPHQNGLATAWQLREIDPDVEIIVCTADPGTVPLSISKEFGNSVFFVCKPPNIEEFAMLVHSLVRSWRERRKLRRRSAMLRRRAEMMRSQTAFLGSLLESVSDLIFMKDTEGVYLTCNKTFARFARRAPEQIIGGSDGDFLPPELCRAFLEQDIQVMESRRPLTYEQSVEHPDGGWCVLETVKSPVFSRSGECIGLLGIARDITNREAAR
jgi:PAS domain S-box-containing protein